MGCQIKVELDGKRVVSAMGYTCKRGLAYAETEFTAPMRTITTTAPIDGGGVVPVKTDRAIPKELMFECMKQIDLACVPKGAKIGYVIIENLLGTGANVVTTRNAE